MTIHLPSRAAPAPETSSELSRILAEQAERDAAEVALHAQNKEVLFDGLRLVGIAHIVVSFDGSGDSGQIESIDARGDLDQSVTLPAAQIDDLVDEVVALIAETQGRASFDPTVAQAKAADK